MERVRTRRVGTVQLEMITERWAGGEKGVGAVQLEILLTARF